MNAPITNPRPITQGAVALMLVNEKPDLFSSTMSPIDADIAREEAEERAKRTATPYEVYKTLKDNASHTKKDVNALVFSKWLQDREWPEEQLQKFGPYMMKLFKAHDGFAVKWVPYDEKGKLQPTRAVYEVYTFTKTLR